MPLYNFLRLGCIYGFGIMSLSDFRYFVSTLNKNLKCNELKVWEFATFKVWGADILKVNIVVFNAIFRILKEPDKLSTRVRAYSVHLFIHRLTSQFRILQMEFWQPQLAASSKTTPLPEFNSFCAVAAFLRQSLDRSWFGCFSAVSWLS